MIRTIFLQGDQTNISGGLRIINSVCCIFFFLRVRTCSCWPITLAAMLLSYCTLALSLPCQLSCGSKIKPKTIVCPCFCRLLAKLYFVVMWDVNGHLTIQMAAHCSDVILKKSWSNPNNNFSQSTSSQHQKDQGSEISVVMRRLIQICRWECLCYGPQQYWGYHKPRSCGLLKKIYSTRSECATSTRQCGVPLANCVKRSTMVR